MAKIDEVRGSLLATLLNIKVLERQLAEQRRIEEGLFQQLGVLQQVENEKAEAAKRAAAHAEQVLAEEAAKRASTGPDSAPKISSNGLLPSSEDPSAVPGAPERTA